MWNTTLLPRFLPGLVLGLLLLSPVPATAAPGDTPELRCRRAIAGALDRWLTDVTRLHQRCQTRVVDGLLSEATDCVATSYPGVAEVLEKMMKESKSPQVPVITGLPA